MAIFQAADILLPDFKKVDGEKWAVIACDQFTSEPEYWKMAEGFIGDAPSARWLIYPEVYLENGFGNLDTIRNIHTAMQTYAKKVLFEHKDSMILVRRTLEDGRVRTGLLGMVDLEMYDYRAGSQSPIRPTEGTVLSRIPPRVQIRDGASLELPHVLLLINDAERSVLEPLCEEAEDFPLAYDFPLMLGGGKVEGRFLPKDAQKAVLAALAKLESASSIAYAVGDGNHSLATARACYEEAKAMLGEEKAKKSRLRYALVELENIYDESIEFHPIYRAVFHVDPEDLLSALPKGDGEQHTFTYRYGNKEGVITLPATAALPVGTLQNALDAYAASHPNIVIDYIHGEDSLRSLASGENAVGFLFEGMKKEELFPSVEADGALPRKTFSMGEAREKRYYIEGRSLR